MLREPVGGPVQRDVQTFLVDCGGFAVARLEGNLHPEDPERVARIVPELAKAQPTHAKVAP